MTFDDVDVGFRNQECSRLDWPEKALYPDVLLKNYGNAMTLSKSATVTLSRPAWKA